MTISCCPKCGSFNITTAGVCANCGWSLFAQVTLCPSVYEATGEIELKISGKALLDDYKRLLFENNSLNARIAELEAAQRWIPVSERLPDTKIVYDKFDVIVELVDTVNGEMIRHVDLLSYDYRNKSWNDDCGEFGFYPVAGVTHWRERPKPPEVQE